MEENHLEEEKYARKVLILLIINRQILYQITSVFSKAHPKPFASATRHISATVDRRLSPTTSQR